MTRVEEFVIQVVTRARSEEGQALSEYSLALVLIFIVCVATLGVLGLAVSGQLQGVADGFP